jgi:hypothetical protein
MTREQSKSEWPPLLQRFVDEAGPQSDYRPRRVRRRFHGLETTLWQGHVHVDDVQGYADNLRLTFFLNRWRSRRGDPNLQPTTDDIYEIMLEADREETKESYRPFHIERIAENIARNGIQEPIVLYSNGGGHGELWDGNRRFFGAVHILKDPNFLKFREQVKWIPALVVTPTGSPEDDLRIKHSIITELNFVEKDHIPWPAYVKAGEIHAKFTRMTDKDRTDPVLARRAKEMLAEEYGLKGWRVADRWIKMYELAQQFKEYHEEEHGRDGVAVDLKVQEEFEYFDEMSKPGVWGCLKEDLDARDEVFQWLWDNKFKAWPDVRLVPRILADPVARRQANAADSGAVKRAIQTVIANDPTRVKDKEAADEKIKQFASWLESFKREDYRQLNVESLESLRSILGDVVKILEALHTTAKDSSKARRR